MTRKSIYILILSLCAFVSGGAMTEYLRQKAESNTNLVIQSLSEEAALYKGIVELSAEFGFSTDVVVFVQTESMIRMAATPDNPAWRLIRTPENLTYIMLSLIYAESGGDPNAIGDSGKAVGLTQIWTTTAKDYDPEATVDKLRNPEYNVHLGFEHFQRLLEKYRGNITLALHSWNRGEGTVDTLMMAGYIDKIDNGYAKKVIRSVEQLTSKN